MALTSGEYYNKKTGASYRVGWYINKEGKRVYCIGVKRKGSDNYRRWRSRSNMEALKILLKSRDKRSLSVGAHEL